MSAETGETGIVTNEGMVDKANAFALLEQNEKVRTAGRWIREVKAPQAEKLKKAIPGFNQRIDVRELLNCLDDLKACSKDNMTMHAEAEEFLDWHSGQNKN